MLGRAGEEKDHPSFFSPTVGRGFEYSYLYRDKEYTNKEVHMFDRFILFLLERKIRNMIKSGNYVVVQGVYDSREYRD